MSAVLGRRKQCLREEMGRRASMRMMMAGRSSGRQDESNGRPCTHLEGTPPVPVSWARENTCATARHSSPPPLTLYPLPVNALFLTLPGLPPPPLLPGSLRGNRSRPRERPNTFVPSFAAPLIASPLAATPAAIHCQSSSRPQTARSPPRQRSVGLFSPRRRPAPRPSCAAPLLRREALRTNRNKKPRAVPVDAQ